MKFRGSRAPGKHASNSTKDMVTPDFERMIGIVRWNSTGFFFTEFAIPYVSKDILGFGGLGIGALFALIIVGSSMSAFLAGYLTDKLRSRKPLLFIGAAGRGASYFLMYASILAGSPVYMSIGTFLLGFCVAFYWVPLDTLMSQKSSKDHRSYAFGRRSAVSSQGIMIGGIIGASIFGLASYLAPGTYWLIYSPLILFGASNFVGGVLFFKRLDESVVFVQPGSGNNLESGRSPETGGGRLSGPPISPPSQSSPVSTTPRASPARGTLPVSFIGGIALLLLGYFLSNVNSQVAKPFIQIYMIEEVTPDPFIVMLLYAPAGLVSMFLGPRLGRAADSIKPSRGIIIFSALGSLETFLLVNIHEPLLFASILVFDASVAMASQLLMSSIFSRISIKDRGKMMGAGMTFANLGGAVGPVIGGMLWDAFTPAAPFIASIFVELAIIPFFLLALKFLKPGMAERLEIEAGVAELRPDEMLP